MSTLDISYFVRYEGDAENRAAFLAHYRDRHAPILVRFPGIRRIVLSSFPPFHQATISEEVFSK